MDDLIQAKSHDFKEKIQEKFKERRNERIKYLGENQAQEIEKRIFLQTVDLNWKSHIQYLEQLRQVVSLRGYAQRDPLIEYKKEAFNLFEHENPEAAYDSLLSNINKNRLIGYVTQKQPTDRDAKEGKYVTGRHETGDKIEFLLDMIPKATIDEYPLWDSEGRYKVESG